ncbi:MAG TPA: caspase family protein [Bacteroidales bacterium]|nr:caspase family protein [Bacteroidales bacterium]
MKKSIYILFLLLLNTFYLSSQTIVPVVQAGHTGSVLFVEWDPTSRYVASIDSNNELVINDLISGKVFYSTKIQTYDNLVALNFKSERDLYVYGQIEVYHFDMLNLKLEKSFGSYSSRPHANVLKMKGAVVSKGMSKLYNRDTYTDFSYSTTSNDENIIVAGDEKGGLYFCNNKLKVKKFTKSHYARINHIAFSPNNKYIAVGSADRSISVWQIPSYNLEKRIIPRSFNISSLESFKDDNLIAFGDELGFVYLLKFEEDKITCEGVNAHNGKINDICFSPNSNVIGTAGGDNRAAVVDFENKKVLQYFILHPKSTKAKQTFNIKGIQARASSDEKTRKNWFDENVYSVAISPDGKNIAYSGGKWGLSNPVLKVSSISGLKINLPKEQRKSKRVNLGLGSKDNKHIFKQIIFTDNKDFIGLGEEENRGIIFNMNITGYKQKERNSTSNLLNKENPNNLLITEIEKEKSPDSYDYIVKKDYSNGDIYTCNGFEISRQHNGKTITFKGHRGPINDFQILKGKDYLISAAEDASMNIWNLSTGEMLLSIYVVDMGKLIFITPDNYYMATGDALTGMGFNFDGKVFPAEQFDLKFNRPDYILESFGYFDEDIIDVYHKAYQKRLAKLGFTEKMLDGKIDLPEIKIANAADISLKTTQNICKLNLEMLDHNYVLDRLNIYVNDIPIYGTKGLSLLEENSKSITKEIEIPLSDGDNYIYISCLNSKGVESLKQEIKIFYNKAIKEKPNLYLISLAVSEYEQSQYNLRYTINDGDGFMKLFQNNKSFNNINIYSLHNQECTKDNVLALKDELMKSKVDDYVYVHIAGHGLLDDELDFYFATVDIDFDDPAKNGLKYDEIEGILDGIPARNKLLLMDACHSGEVDKDDDFATDDKNSEDDTRGVTMFTNKNKNKPKTGLRNSFELMRLLFADLKKGTGTVVISAASGSGYALEIEKIENGIFTYCLINGIQKGKADTNKDKIISVSELRNYIFNGVKELSNGKQQPTSRQENLMNDFRVW